MEVLINKRLMDHEYILREFARDLCTCTEKEIRERWSKREIEALEKIKAGTFHKRILNHNPFYYLAQQVYFDNVAHRPEFLYAPLHRDRLCKSLEDYLLGPDGDEYAALQILIQRDSFKSTFMHGVVPLSLSLRHKHLFGESIRILLRHHKELQASMNLQRLMKKCVYHKFMQETWPEFCGQTTKDLGTQTEVTWPWNRSGDQAEVNIMAAGLKASQTGFHQDYTFNDDLVTEEHIKSKTIRDMAKELYSHSRYTLDMKRGREVDSGTRYHINDLWASQQKAKRRDGSLLYKVLRIKAVEDNGELSFPTRHSHEVLEIKRQEEIARSGNDFLWWLQMQNEPKSEGLVATRPEWIKVCKLEDVNPRGFGVIFVDPAWKGTDNWGEGDNASIQAWMLERRGNLVLQTLLEVVTSNEMTDDDGINHIFRMGKLYGIMHCAPEERGGKSFGTRVFNEGLVRGWPMQIIKLETQQMGKSQRIGTFLGAMQSGRVYFTEDCGDFKKFMDEFEDYPQIDHDDSLDCAAYTQDPAITKAYVPKFNQAAYQATQARSQAPPARTRYCA